MRLTDEQVEAIAMFRLGQSLQIQAGAGTGKTSTLRQIGLSTKRIGQFTAFNKAVVEDAALAMPENVACATSHSIAYRARGKRFRHRIDSPRMRSMDIARRLRIDPLPLRLPGGHKTLSPGHLASLTLRSIAVFCQSADPEPLPRHVPYQNGIDQVEENGRRGMRNNLLVREALARPMLEAWDDLQRENGDLPFTPDCQPAGTLVRRVVRYGGGVAGAGVYEDVPIEQISVGDRVVSFTSNLRRSYVRRAGRLVTAAGQRDYSGDLISVMTARGRMSSYTPEHICVVRLSCELAAGNHVVYLARQGSNYRVGRTTWRSRSQNNRLGLRVRGEAMKADAMWVLSAHASDSEAALAEATTAQQFRLPSWQFSAVNEVMPLALFWAKFGNNRADAAACLRANGRDIRFPLWERGAGWDHLARPITLRACNLMEGMLALEVDEIEPGANGELWGGSREGWSPVSVCRGFYSGPVFSLDVESDHTYVADGIVTHNCYMKIWALDSPRIPGDFILLDEAQDTAPVLLGALLEQDAQLVAVGDSQQALYEWRGAINALAQIPAEAITYLTRSWRFGPAIAEVANAVLGMLDTELRISGCDIESRVGRIDGDPRAILCRSNAEAMKTVLRYQKDGTKAHLVGGGSEIAYFARSALQMQEERWTSHPDLACFSSWDEVLEYVQQDPRGDELRLMVSLVEEFTAEVIIKALEFMPAEEQSAIIVSTAHKSKGREWPTVRLAGDFQEPDGDGWDGEWRLLYVAATRAREVLDISLCEPLQHLLDPEQATPTPKRLAFDAEADGGRW